MPKITKIEERKQRAAARVTEIFKVTQQELAKPTVTFIRCRRCRQTKHNKHFNRSKWCWNLCRNCARNHNKLYSTLKKTGKKYTVFSEKTGKKGERKAGNISASSCKKKSSSLKIFLRETCSCAQFTFQSPNIRL